MKPFSPESLPQRGPPPPSIQGRPSPTVVNGKIQSLSVTGMAKFRPEEEGCQLRWWYKTIAGWSEPSRSFTSVGDVMHDQLDFYLSHGADGNANVLGKLAMSGFHLLPPPGPHPDLKVEWGLNRLPRERKNGKKVNFFPPAQSKLHAAGIPLIGFLDVEDSGPEHILPDGSIIYEPDVVEVIDHKSSSKAKWTKPAEKFLEIVQMCGYGVFVAGLPEYERIKSVRLSQINYLTSPPLKGEPAAFKNSILIPVATLREKWSTGHEQTAEQMKSVASERDERKIPGNLEACESFSGCPHKDHCWTWKASSPVEKLRLSLKKSNAVPTPEAKSMSNLLNKVRGLAAPVNGAVPGLPPGPPAAQLTAKDAISGGGYKFSTGAVGMFLSATNSGAQVVYSFLLVGPDGKAGGTPFHVLPTEPVELVIPPIQVQAAAPAVPGLPPGPPAGQTPWIPTTAAAPTTEAPPKIRRLGIQDVPSTGAEPAAPSVPAPPKLGRPKKADAALAPVAQTLQSPTERRAEVEQALTLAHEVYHSLYGADASFEQTVAIAELLLG